MEKLSRIAGEGGFDLLSFTGKMKTLHMTWFAFFLSFVVWFNAAPPRAGFGRYRVFFHTDRFIKVDFLAWQKYLTDQFINQVASSDW